MLFLHQMMTFLFSSGHEIIFPKVLRSWTFSDVVSSDHSHGEFWTFRHFPDNCPSTLSAHFGLISAPSWMCRIFFHLAVMDFTVLPGRFKNFADGFITVCSIFSFLLSNSFISKHHVQFGDLHDSRTHLMLFEPICHFELWSLWTPEVRDIYCASLPLDLKWTGGPAEDIWYECWKNKL